MTVEDHLFRYRVAANAYPAHCHIRIIRQKKEADALLIVSELASNEGMSVCNAFEDLLPQIACAYGIGPEHLTVIEHWGPFSYGDHERDEEFSRITYTYEPDRPSWPSTAQLGSFSEPQWHPISRADVEEIAAGELPAFPFEVRPLDFGLSPTPEGGR